MNELINELRDRVAELGKSLGNCEIQYQSRCDEVAYQMNRAETAEKRVAELEEKLETSGFVTDSLDDYLSDKNKFAIEKQMEVLEEMRSFSSEYLWEHNELEIYSNYLVPLLRNFCNYKIKQLRAKLGDKDNE